VEPPALTAAVPELAFAVEDAAPAEHAAAPALVLRLRVDAPGADVRSLMLDADVRIAARRRAYDRGEQERLAEIFGEPARWSQTLRTFSWLRRTQVVPPFSGTTRVDLVLPCTYDFEVLAARYLSALGDDGTVPLEVLFSGTVLYALPDGRLQVARIGWDREAAYDLPARVWRQAMDRHFPGAAWLRLQRETFEALQAYRSREALPGWDATILRLLEREAGR